MSYLPEKPTTLSIDVGMAESEVRRVVRAERAAQSRQAAGPVLPCCARREPPPSGGTGRTGRDGGCDPRGVSASRRSSRRRRCRRSRPGCSRDRSDPRPRPRDRSLRSDRSVPARSGTRSWAGRRARTRADPSCGRGPANPRRCIRGASNGPSFPGACRADIATPVRRRVPSIARRDRSAGAIGSAGIRATGIGFASWSRFGGSHQRSSRKHGGAAGASRSLRGSERDPGLSQS